MAGIPAEQAIAWLDMRKFDKSLRVCYKYNCP